MIKHWFVVTPPFGDFMTMVDGSPDDAVGLAVTVQAEDEDQALIRAWDHDGLEPWFQYCAGPANKDPEAGMRVFDAKCEHGNCLCDECDEACLICDADLLAEVDEDDEADWDDGNGPWSDGKGNEG